MDKKIEYFTNRCSLLEKENEQLKKEKAALELQLVSYNYGLNETMSKTKKILKDAIIAKNAYEEALSEIKDKTGKLTEISDNAKLICDKYEKKFVKKIERELNKYKI